MLEQTSSPSPETPTILKKCPKSTLESRLKGTSFDEVVELESTAYKLQPYVATWYNALRTIALIGLLSVLLYLGIRIILSSTSAQDKAKYKNMMKDWIVAICIIFVLHYIMAFMLQVSSLLIEIINGNVIEITDASNTKDELMSYVRTQLGDYKNSSGAQTFGYTVMYLVLVILTGVFTFQYLKRVIFMAFLTIIAPLIALTYPLDKLKDGKAQAFSYWLREYIFNCLIQPVHLMLYTIFITSAINFAKENVLYAIVALAFMVPAEKIIKEMFGMKSNSPSSTLGAAAGGAFVMSMINKLKKPPKDGAGAGESSGGRSSVRTASNNVGSSGATGGTGATGGVVVTGGGGSSRGGGAGRDTGTIGATGGTGETGGTGATGSTGVNGGSGISGASTVGHTIRGASAIKSGIGRFSRGVGGAALGAVTGTMSLAAQVADGDLFNNPSKAFSEIGTGVGAGYLAGSNLIRKTGTETGKFKNWIDEKTLGTEEFNNRNFDKKFYKSDGYKMIKQDPTIQALCKNNGVKVENAVQTFLNEGITDTTKIRDALQNGISGEIYKTYDKAGVSSGKDIVKLQASGIGADDMKKFSSAGETDVNKIISLKNKSKYRNRSNEHLANMYKLAKHVPKNLSDFKDMMVGREFNGRILTENEAEEIFKELVDFF